MSTRLPGNTPPCVGDRNVLYVDADYASVPLSCPKGHSCPDSGVSLIGSLVTKMERKPPTRNVALYTKLLNNRDVRLC